MSLLCILSLSFFIKKTNFATTAARFIYSFHSLLTNRDDWIAKINHLRERNEKDSRQHVLEIKEFHRTVHHERKIQNFLDTKNKRRGEMESGGERRTRKLIAKVDELDAILVAYKRSFIAILKLAESKNIEVLLTTYMDQEQRNFAMFKSIIDVNNEV